MLFPSCIGEENGSMIQNPDLITLLEKEGGNKTFTPPRTLHIVANPHKTSPLEANKSNVNLSVLNENG